MVAFAGDAAAEAVYTAIDAGDSEEAYRLLRNLRGDVSSGDLEFLRRQVDAAFRTQPVG